MISFNHEFCNIYVITRYSLLIHLSIATCIMHAYETFHWAGLLHEITHPTNCRCTVYTCRTLWCGNFVLLRRSTKVTYSLGAWSVLVVWVRAFIQKYAINKVSMFFVAINFLKREKSRGKISKINYTLASHKENCRCRPMSSFFLPSSFLLNIPTVWFCITAAVTLQKKKKFK